MNPNDLAPITRILRAKASSNLLVSAVHHLHIFEQMSEEPLSLNELKIKLQLKDRPAMVIFPALCAMGFLQYDNQKRLEITELGKYLMSSTKPNLKNYIGLEKNDPAVLDLTELIKEDGPKDKSIGISYVKDQEAPSPMDDAESARFFTEALAGRAELLSPIVAQKITKKAGHLVDVAGGSGFYTYNWLLINPDSTATIMDRPEVLKIAKECLNKFLLSGKAGVGSIKERVEFVEGDMLTDEVPLADLILAASLFHDWPAETCQKLIFTFAKALKNNGSLWVHDCYLDDTLDGPLAATDYSIMLFSATKGRLYSRKEYRKWFSEAGLVNNDENIPTGMDYGLIWSYKN